MLYIYKGMLSSWVVWIVFRWKKVPEICRSQRNCQLLSVTVAIAVTLGFSFSPYVDWAAHFGGFTMVYIIYICIGYDIYKNYILIKYYIYIL